MPLCWFIKHLKEVSYTGIQRDTFLYVRTRGFSTQRYYYLHSEKPKNIKDLWQLNKKEIEAFALKIIEVNGLMEIVPGAFLIGKIDRIIDRITAYKK